MPNLFDVLEKENLSTMKIEYNWRNNHVTLNSAKLWDKNTKWSDYNTSFFLSSSLISESIHLDDKQTREVFKKHNEYDYLEKVIDLVKKGKHFFMELFYDPKNNIRIMNNIHSDTLGINNRSHAIRAGGIRRHDLDEPEYDVIIDGLNLSRGMSFKNAAARIPYGGSKFTVQMKPVDLNDMEQVGFISYAVDRSRVFTGPDMGFPTELADVMNKNFTLNIVGGPGGSLGATGVPTAYGTYLAIKEASRFVFNTPDLKGKKIAVQGLGAVGFILAEHLLKENVNLVVSDLDENPIKELKDKHPNNNIEVLSKDEILTADVDILSPCAIGGIISKELIPNLKCKIIIGAANNELKASSQEEEYELAKLLDEKGILYQVDWWHNGGGVLCGREEYISQENASMDNVLKAAKEIGSKYTWENLIKAKELGITPTECAYKTIENLIYT